LASRSAFGISIRYRMYDRVCVAESTRLPTQNSHRTRSAWD